MSEQNIIAAFNADYAAAQAECENPPLDSTNPAYRSKFASLAATRNAVIPIFSKRGIAIQQTAYTEMIGERLFAGVKTALRHKAGHVEHLDPCLMPVQKMDAQGIASCMTYAKRQSLQALAGVTGEVDDDANEASGKVGNSTPLKHSPLGDAPPSDAAVKYADALREAIAAQDFDAAYQVHLDLHEEGEETYRSAWALLDSKTRSATKRVIEQRKAA